MLHDLIYHIFITQESAPQKGLLYFHHGQLDVIGYYDANEQDILVIYSPQVVSWHSQTEAKFNWLWAQNTPFFV